MDLSELKTIVLDAGADLLFGIVVLIVGLFLTHWLVRLICGAGFFKKLDTSLQSFFRNLMKIVLTVIVVLTAANVIGVPLTSVITLFASAGVAISPALQGALGNLVGGVTLLILKPIKSGEYVKIGDHTGFVKNIGAFYTEIKTFENSVISIPNSSLTNTAIVNYTREGVSRIEVSFMVGYETNIDKARDTLIGVAGKCGHVLEDPAPLVILSKCLDSGMEVVVRVWAKPENMWTVRYYLLEEGKKALDVAGISIPFPQMDVHVKND